MRLFSAVLIAGATATATAAELSTYDPIGFSPDGELFAFIEYGVQDGSGAPYANGFAIRVADDAFVAGTPIRLGGGEPGDLSDAELLGSVRGLRTEARVLIEEATGEGRWRPGDLLAFSPVTDLDRDGRQVTVNPRYIPSTTDGALTAQLETIPFANDTNDCPDFGSPIVGFRLTIEDGHNLATLNEDASVPGSRGCPLDYRIGGIETYHAPDGTRSVAVLVQMLTIGFEGRDGRWLAVTHRGPIGTD